MTKSSENAGRILPKIHKRKKNSVSPVGIDDQMMTSVENCTYTDLDLIGKGSSAKVYRCRHNITGMAYAMKIVEKTKFSKEIEEIAIKRMRREIAITKQLK